MNERERALRTLADVSLYGLETDRQKRTRRAKEKAEAKAEEKKERAKEKQRARQKRYLDKKHAAAKIEREAKKKQERRLLRTDSPEERALKLRRRRQRRYLANKKKREKAKAKAEIKRARDEKCAIAVSARKEKEIAAEKHRVKQLGWSAGFASAYHDIGTGKEPMSMEEQKKSYGPKWREGYAAAWTGENYEAIKEATRRKQ
jgi:hypothetical protein